MILTDTTIVNETLAVILAKESMIAVDVRDIKRLFGDAPQLQMIKVAGDTVDEVVAKLKEVFSEIGGCPDTFFAAYVSMILRISDLEALNQVSENASNSKRTIIFETDPEGAIVLYYFF